MHYGRFWNILSGNCMDVKTSQMGCFTFQIIISTNQTVFKKFNKKCEICQICALNSLHKMFFLTQSYSRLCVLSYGISYMHLKSCWVTQKSLEQNPFSTFCLICPNSISKKNGEKIRTFALAYICTQNHLLLHLLIINNEGQLGVRVVQVKRHPGKLIL